MRLRCAQWRAVAKPGAAGAEATVPSAEFGEGLAADVFLTPVLQKGAQQQRGPRLVLVVPLMMGGAQR